MSKSSPSDVSVFFRPFACKSLELPNRIVMAPMTRNFSPGRVPGADLAEYYRKRAAGGVGLIITEGTAPEAPAPNDSGQVPVFYGPEALAGWRRVAEQVHGEGARIAPQLWHMGMLRRQDKAPDAGDRSLGPSGTNTAGGKRISEPMTQSEIETVIEGFAKSAAYAREIGFDCVEIHGAHGYLIDQFFWEGTNMRQDAYGGGLDQRQRFASDLIAAVRRAVGDDFVIILRYSQWKQQDYDVKLAPTPQDLERFLAPLTDAGVDIFHCSTRRVWEPEFEGSDLNLAGWTKKLTGKPTIAVGSIGLDSEFISTYGSDEPAQPASLDNLIERMEREEFDLVAVGRALIANPDWAEKIRTGHMDALKPFARPMLADLA